MKKEYNIYELFKGEKIEHSLSLFKKEDREALKIFDKNGKPYLICYATDKERPAKPEEIVRQLFIKKLLKEYNYPRERLAIEKEVWFGSGIHEKSADIVV